MRPLSKEDVSGLRPVQEFAFSVSGTSIKIVKEKILSLG